MKKIELLANIAVVITSVVLCSVLAKTYFFSPATKAERVAAKTPTSPTPNSEQRHVIQPGTKISLPGIDWRQSHSTLVLALSTKCHFCTESAAFYQQLVKEHDGRIRLLAVLPQAKPDEINYLHSLGINLDSVQAQLASIGVTGTPTLLLVDDQGEVRDSWVGKLPEVDQAKVITRINEGVSQ